jgi:phosphate uptake regulator
MIRKVIKQGHNTLTITLPCKWCEENSIKPGSEIHMGEFENSIILSSQLINKKSYISMDISKLDRCSILFTIRNLYRIGYDEIELTYSNNSTKYHRVMKELPILDVIKYEVSNLVGLEIIEQGGSRVLIKDISNTKGDDFHQILRRIFLLLDECGEDVISNLKNYNENEIMSIKEKHDIITKFVSYCLRCLNKSSITSCKRKELMYHILSSFDKIADVYKNTARDMVAFKLKTGKTAIGYANGIIESFKLYEKLFYKYDLATMSKINEIRDKIRKEMRDNLQTLNKKDILFITGIVQILELIADMVVTRMGLEI